MRKIVLFGSGVVAEKNLRRDPVFIVDNNTDLQGTGFHGVPVVSPDKIRDKSHLYDVVVCTTSIDSVRTQLADMGFTWNENATIAPQLKERMSIDSLEREKFRFLFSSGLPSHRAKTSGGGVFYAEETSDGLEIKKLFEGNVHGLIEVEKEGYFFNAQGDGLYMVGFELNQNPKKVMSVPKGHRPHGMARYQSCWLLVSSYEDSLLMIDEGGEVINRFDFSSKKSSYFSAQHHCNDVAVLDDFAYVSMFSVSGNWKRGIYDGGIVEICLKSGNQKILKNDLKMPHNVSFYQNELRVMNSFKGEIMMGDFEIYGQLPGFVRGYCEDEKYLCVGESKNRNFFSLKTGRFPVSIDTRITIIEKSVKACRSMQMPNSISEIHSIIRL